MATQTVIVKGAKAAGGIGKGLLLAKRVFFIGFLFLTFLIIFMNAIIQSVNERSAEPLLTELGSRFFFASQALEIASQDVIDHQGMYDPEGPWYGDTWEWITNFSELIFAVLVIWTWMRVFMWIYKKSPISDESRWFVNFLLALGSFIILESMAIIIRAAVAGTIIDYKHAMYLASLPVQSFWTFFKCLPYVFGPIAESVGNKWETFNINDTAQAVVNGSS